MGRSEGSARWGAVDGRRRSAIIDRPASRTRSSGTRRCSAIDFEVGLAQRKLSTRCVRATCSIEWPSLVDQSRARSIGDEPTRGSARCQLRLSSNPGGLLPRGPHQNRTRRFPPSGSSADVAHGDAPQIRTRIRGTGRGYRSNNATNLGQGSTTFRISGDMSPDVHAPVMGPFERSHQHGPSLLGRVRGPTRAPTSSLVCSPPTPSLPSAAAPVVPGRWPTLSLCDKEEEGPPRCLGRPLPACRRLRPRWVRVSACSSRRDRHRLQAAQCPGHPE